jgi:hypothetical protein
LVYSVQQEDDEDDAASLFYFIGCSVDDVLPSQRRALSPNKVQNDTSNEGIRSLAANCLF